MTQHRPSCKETMRHPARCRPVTTKVSLQADLLFPGVRARVQAAVAASPRKVTYAAALRQVRQAARATGG